MLVEQKVNRGVYNFISADSSYKSSLLMLLVKLLFTFLVGEGKGQIYISHFKIHYILEKLHQAQKQLLICTSKSQSFT